MGAGNKQMPTCSRLLKRRYSVPEIIMRKHELAQQKPYGNFTSESIPSPKMLPSTGISNSNSTSSISRNILTDSPGSDSNLSRTGPERDVSLRKSSLLRQMWEKETRLRQGKTPSLRLLSQKGYSVEGTDSHCEECKRLNISRDDDGMESDSQKYFLNGRLNQMKKTPSPETTSSTSDFSQPMSQISTQESLGCTQEQYNSPEKRELYVGFDEGSKFGTDLSNSKKADQEIRYTNQSKERCTTSDQPENSSAADDADSGDSALDDFISQMLIENLCDLAEETRERCKKRQYIECFKNKGNSSTFPETNKISGGEEDSIKPDSTTTACTLQIATDEAGNAKTSIEDNTSDCIIKLDNIPSGDVIQIRAGSSYPSNEGVDLLVIPRVLTILPRTESVEVQPSSASAVEEEVYCHNSDESLSLVDSLDDPNIIEDNEIRNISPTVSYDKVDHTLKEKSQAFFVPIVDSGQESMENIPVVSESMPDKLKERIVQRQMELDAKKESYKKLQPSVEDILTNVKSESESAIEKRTKPKKGLVPLETKTQSRSSRANKEMLRNDIGLLESYTVDSRGNLQFRVPQKAKTKGPNSHKSKMVKKQNIVTYRPPKSVKSSSSSSSYSKKNKVSPKEVQKMTIFQTQSDIITPDHENGPRRIYQKTEIQDGEKRIEILEIVECVESSEENSPVRQNKAKCVAKSASFRRSRIPVPIYKIGRSAGCQKSIRSRDTCNIFGRSTPRDIQQCTSPKVDRAIAELLMGALNRSDQAVIEMIRSPREILSSRPTRGQISKRNTPKRSSSSGKYRQVFEVIPEEKSSLSMDSSNEESSKDARNSEEQSSNNTNTTVSNSSKSHTTKPVVTTLTTSTSPTSCRTPSRGRESVETVEPKAWVGFLDTQESFVEEEDGTTQPYPSSTTDTSNFTITSISTAAATHGSQTSKNESANHTSSSESDNILKLITTMNSGSDKTDCRNESLSSPKHNVKSPANRSDRHIIQVRECMNMNVNDNLNSSQGGKDSTDEKVIHYKGSSNSSNVDVWRVQSPDICMRAIPKSKICNSYENCPADSETAEIDSRSFIICSDDSAINNSDQTSTILNDLHGCEEIRKEIFNMCTACCFCNPDLHNTKSTNADFCLYCNRKKTPQKKEEETNTESDFFTKHDTYQSTSIKDHRHTMSRDSDSVSTKCTRTNEKIKRYIPESSRASSESHSNNKKNLNRPKNINNLPKFEKRPVSKVVKDNVKGSSPPKKSEVLESKLGAIRSPYKQFSSCGYDRSSSPTSSSDSTCPTTPERRLLFPKVKCRNEKRRVKKKSEVVAEIKKEASAEVKPPPVATNSTNSGWTVTLAGTCTQGPPPDVEMRLSFPKDSATATVNKIEGISEKNRFEELPEQNSTYDRNGNTRRNSVLPPAGNMDSRRALPNNATGSSFQRDLIFPDVTINTPPQNQVVPRQVTTKKAIRHLECNVAVTSATRTVSNITRGRRTMSYQALNAGEPPKYSSRERQLRDSSLDLGFLSSRRMSFGSQSPLETMALSIMGNAIAPEQKPRVPTMSERDLTRRHNKCFTRNRAFFT